MRILGITKKYRNFGIGFGLPVFIIEYGLAQSLEPIAVADRILEMGIRPHTWVICTNGIMREQGFGTLLKALKVLKAYVEVEDDSSGKTPGDSFNLVDRYIIDWPATQFNIGALRPARDLLVCRGEEVKKFIKETEKESSIRVIECEDPSKIWDLVQNTNIRVYKRRS